jgi:ribonuclease HI
MKRFYCDGANENGQSGWGFWIEEDGKKIEEKWGVLEGTSNEAEWTAVVEATKRAKEIGEEVEIFSDSNLIINQLTGKWRTKAPHLKHFVRSARENLLGITWSAEWIPREENECADELSKRGILRKSSSFPKPSMYRAYLRDKGLLKY